jgi:AraC-like DNA-binding protein
MTSFTLDLAKRRDLRVRIDSFSVPATARTEFEAAMQRNLQSAAGALVTGHTVTEAAHLAGFADASHLTRTFRRTLGTTPREMIRRAPAAHELRLASASDSQSVHDASA